MSWGFANLRVHDLTHTFGRRLSVKGVQLETRKVLLGHRNGDITCHYSAPEIDDLLKAANRVCEIQPRKTPALTVLRSRTDQGGAGERMKSGEVIGSGGAITRKRAFICRAIPAGRLMSAFTRTGRSNVTDIGILTDG